MSAPAPGGARRFDQVDVFGSAPLAGNPLAVVHDATGLDDARMAALARWTNLSETTFLLPPTDPAADYRVRIFTPGGELPFAGHPTLGSCHAWLAAGGVPRAPGTVVQECGVGLVPVRRDGARLAFGAPPLRRTGPLDTATLEASFHAIADALRKFRFRLHFEAQNRFSWRPGNGHRKHFRIVDCDDIDRAFAELSGGEKQRVLIAMILVQAPRIILLDEATSHLDLNHRLEILELVARLNRDIRAILATPEFKKGLLDQGMTPVGNSREAARQFIAAEKAKWDKVIQQGKISLD